MTHAQRCARQQLAQEQRHEKTVSAGEERRADPHRVEPVERVAARPRRRACTARRARRSRAAGSRRRRRRRRRRRGSRCSSSSASAQPLGLGRRPQRAAEELATMSARCTPASTTSSSWDLSFSGPGRGHLAGLGEVLHVVDVDGLVRRLHRRRPRATTRAALRNATSAHSQTTPGMPLIACSRGSRWSARRPIAASSSSAATQNAQAPPMRAWPTRGTIAPSSGTTICRPARTTASSARCRASCAVEQRVAERRQDARETRSAARPVLRTHTSASMRVSVHRRVDREVHRGQRDPSRSRDSGRGSARPRRPAACRIVTSASRRPSEIRRRRGTCACGPNPPAAAASPGRPARPAAGRCYWRAQRHRVRAGQARLGVGEGRRRARRAGPAPGRSARPTARARGPGMGGWRSTSGGAV